MNEMNNCVALLPMKLNSERVKGKNFRMFAGRPLFWWILDTLRRIETISRIIINTDAREKLEENGLKESDRIVIRDRKESLLGDEVSMNRILEDDLEAVHSDFYLMTHTTNPLLGEGTLRKAIAEYREALGEGRADSLFSVNRHQTRFYKENGSPINHDPENLLPTQELEPWYEENSNLYLFTRSSFQESGSRIGKRPILFETPKMESTDIDSETEWRIAEVLALSKQLFEAQS